MNTSLNKVSSSMRFERKRFLKLLNDPFPKNHKQSFNGNGECLTKGIVYQAEVKTDYDKKTLHRNDRAPIQNKIQRPQTFL